MSSGASLNGREITTAFVDRDGTINREPTGRYVLSADELQILPGAGRAIRILNTSEVRVIVVTNQQGVGLGILSMTALEEIHLELERQLALHDAQVDGILTCPHIDGTCDCRKPAAGLLLQSKERWPSIDFDKAVMIGDSQTDVAAGKSVGTATVLLGMSDNEEVAPDRRASSLIEAVLELTRDD